MAKWAKWENRERKLQKRKNRMKQSGRNTGENYRNAILKEMRSYDK